MTSVLLVPDLAVERWPSMDRYALKLLAGLRSECSDLEIALGTSIDTLTHDHTTGTDESGMVETVLGRSRGETGEMRRYVSRYLLYPRRLRRLRGDVVHVLDHSYAHVVGSQTRRPNVVTVHDLLPVMTVERPDDGLRSRVRNRLLEWVLESLRKADGWIVATEWLRNELAQWLGRDDNIFVIPFGVDEAFFAPPAADKSVLRRALGIPDSAFVVLHVGSVGARKNINAVIATVAGLRKGGLEGWLLQVGGEFTAAQREDLGQRNLTSCLTTLGAAAETDLRRAYHAADVLLFPSHYEGFGFPVLEAMASGLPVVNSGVGGLTEVSGDAAVIVGGREVEPYVASLANLAGDGAWRDEIIRRGIERAARYRWTETARRTADVYADLATR